MLKKIRKTIALIVLLQITLLFLDFTGVVHLWFGWLAKVQLLPAILAVNVAVLVGLALMTILFGRIYCSVICPLGIMQDGISNISAKRKGKKTRFRFSAEMKWLRYGVLTLCVAAFVIGVSILVSLLDPYAAYGRIASSFLVPLYRLGNNVLAWFSESIDSYMFYSTEVWMKSWITLGVSAVTLLIIGLLSWKNGRTYCNTICPVGTLLGLLSRFSVFAPRFDTDKCVKCGACERHCKASCIDFRSMHIDHSRCVTCFNCVESCKFQAMNYTLKKKKAEKVEASSVEVHEDHQKGVSRRNFLSIVGLVTMTHSLKAQQLQVDGGLAELEDKKIPHRNTPIVPPGAESVHNLNQHCTACQLCVSACPNNVLRPSSKLSTLMQPEMSYERGYCRPECIECSAVCPAGAIKPVTKADKAGLSIGQAVWVKENCVVNTDEVQCSNCERHCPTKAIILVPKDANDEKSLKIPVVDKELCIGCGACEYLCPARPFSAIYVEGNVRHHAV